MNTLPRSYSGNPTHITRVMTPADLKVVCQIDRDAFEAYRRQQRQLVRPMRLRTPENMNAAIRRPFPGVVVESPQGRVVGYCFTHVWGSLGWLGTLGVAPPNQGFGLGRAVTAAGLDLLRQAGCTTLALETMPESGKNLALYMGLGLEARTLTLVCQGTPIPAASTTFAVWEGGSTLRDVAGQVLDGLDPTPAARWLVDEEAGRTLVWHEAGRATAFAIVRHGPRRLESIPDYVTVEVAVCLPEAADRWARYLGEMQTYARRMGKSGVALPVNTQQIALTNALLGAGMRITYTRVSMVSKGGSLGGPDDLLMLTLAM